MDDWQAPLLPSLFLGSSIVRRGDLTVTHIEDGRTLLRFRADGTSRTMWLELMPEDRQWLIEALSEHPWEVSAS